MKDKILDKIETLVINGKILLAIDSHVNELFLDRTVTFTAAIKNNQFVILGPKVNPEAEVVTGVYYHEPKFKN